MYVGEIDLLALNVHLMLAITIVSLRDGTTLLLSLDRDQVTIQVGIPAFRFDLYCLHIMGVTVQVLVENRGQVTVRVYDGVEVWVRYVGLQDSIADERLARLVSGMGWGLLG